MAKRTHFALTCLLISTVLIACESSQADHDALATKVAASIFATQTAEAPIPTKTSTRIPTSTLIPATTVSTYTPIPTTVPPTFTPSVITLGNTVLAGHWKITVVQVSQEPSIRTEYARMDPGSGGMMLAVRLRLENTASTSATLELNLKNLFVADATGENHLSRGVGFGERTMDNMDVMWALLLGQGFTGSGSVPLPDGGLVTFDLTTKDESGTLTISMPAQSTTLSTLAFYMPIASSNLRLYWPGLPPISLGKVSAP